MSEIVSAVGGRPVTFIRYNPDTVRWKGKAKIIDPKTRINLLIEVLKDELLRKHEDFAVNMFQLWYDDSETSFLPCKHDNITYDVTI